MAGGQAEKGKRERRREEGGKLPRQDSGPLVCFLLTGTSSLIMSMHPAWLQRELHHLQVHQAHHLCIPRSSKHNNRTTGHCGYTIIFFVWGCWRSGGCHISGGSGEVCILCMRAHTHTYTNTHVHTYIATQTYTHTQIHSTTHTHKQETIFVQ